MKAKGQKRIRIGMKICIISFVCGGISLVLSQTPFFFLFFVTTLIGLSIVMFGGLQYQKEIAQLDEKWETEPIKLISGEPEFKKKLFKKIVNGQTEQAIKSLIGIVKDESSVLFQELIQLEIQNIRLESNVIKGVISGKEENLERNQINDRLLTLINHIEFDYEGEGEIVD